MVETPTFSFAAVSLISLLFFFRVALIILRSYSRNVRVSSVTNDRSPAPRTRSLGSSSFLTDIIFLSSYRVLSRSILCRGFLPRCNSLKQAKLKWLMRIRARSHLRGISLHKDPSRRSLKLLIASGAALELFRKVGGDCALSLTPSMLKNDSTFMPSERKNPRFALQVKSCRDLRNRTIVPRLVQSVRRSVRSGRRWFRPKAPGS